VPMHEQRARAKGRSAMMLLLRRGLALAAFAILLYQQPFMVRRKDKVVPLHVAVSGAVSLGADHAPARDAINTASRSLLTPLEYWKARHSRNSTLASAYEKTERRLSRILDGNTSTAARLAAAPMPNVPAVGSYLLTAGSAVALFLPGSECVVLAGCGCLWLGCEGMSSQPELAFVGLLAALGLYAIQSAKAPAAEKPKRRRGRGSAAEQRLKEREAKRAAQHVPLEFEKVAAKPHAE